MAQLFWGQVTSAHLQSTHKENRCESFMIQFRVCHLVYLILLLLLQWTFYCHCVKINRPQGTNKGFIFWMYNVHIQVSSMLHGFLWSSYSLRAPCILLIAGHSNMCMVFRVVSLPVSLFHFHTLPKQMTISAKITFHQSSCPAVTVRWGNEKTQAGFSRAMCCGSKEIRKCSM